MNNIAIKVSHLTKIYKLYDKPIDRLKESLHPLKKQYHKEFYALNDVSFEIKKGETVGIIGKNGAGKSTLLKIITGVLTPTNGSVHVNGRIASLLELGAGFNPEYTGVENIYLQGTLMGYSHEEMEAKVDDILAFADIGDFVYQPVKSYSSGMFARLAFAVAINVEPDILIVDEALSVGDINFQSKSINKIIDMKKNGLTLLLVSHDLTTVNRVAERVMWLHGALKMDDDSAFVISEFLAMNNKIDETISKELIWGKKNHRMGIGTYKINSIQFLNSINKITNIFNVDESFTIDIFTDLVIGQDKFNFSVTFFSKDGTYLYGTATMYQDVVVNNKNIRFSVKKLHLLPGVYDISIGLWDELCQVPYDLHEKKYEIQVKNILNLKYEGIVNMECNWEAVNED